MHGPAKESMTTIFNALVDDFPPEKSPYFWEGTSISFRLPPRWAWQRNGIDVGDDVEINLDVGIITLHLTQVEYHDDGTIGCHGTVTAVTRH